MFSTRKSPADGKGEAKEEVTLQKSLNTLVTEPRNDSMFSNPLSIDTAIKYLGDYEW